MLLIGSCTVHVGNWKGFPSRNGQGYKLRQQTLHVQSQSQPGSSYFYLLRVTWLICCVNQEPPENKMLSAVKNCR
jgi:hypothetical protein